MPARSTRRSTTSSRRRRWRAEPMSWLDDTIRRDRAAGRVGRSSRIGTPRVWHRTGSDRARAVCDGHSPELTAASAPRRTNAADRHRRARDPWLHPPRGPARPAVGQRPHDPRDDRRSPRTVRGRSVRGTGDVGVRPAARRADAGPAAVLGCLVHRPQAGRQHRLGPGPAPRHRAASDDRRRSRWSAGSCSRRSASGSPS